MSRKRAKSAPPPDAPVPPGRGGPCLRVALALVGASLIVGAALALVTPWDPQAPGAARRTPPDEIAHLLYIQDLVRNRALPLLRSGSGNYEAHQPPLYYLSAVPARQVGALLDPPADPARPGITAGEVLAVRLWSVAIAAGVILSCYLLACAVFPDSPLLQTAAPAFALLLPGHTANLAAITNDGLAELLTCLALWLCALVVREPGSGLRRVVGLGAVIGAALLTKTTSLFLLPVAALALVLARPREPKEEAHGWSWVLLRAGIVLGVSLALWGGWIVHNLAHYPGDPIVARTFIEVFGKDRPGPETFLAAGLTPFGYLRLVLVWTYLSYWGVLGEAAVFMPPWYYLLGTALTVAVLPGLAARPSAWRAMPSQTRDIWRILAAAGILVALQFFRFNMTFFQAQARYLFPAIGPIACAAVLGLHRGATWWAGRRLPTERVIRWAFALCGAAMAVLLGAALIASAMRGPVGGAPPWIGLP